MSPQAKLDAFKADFQAGKPPYNVPPAVIEAILRVTAELKASGLAECSLKVGAVAPPTNSRMRVAPRSDRPNCSRVVRW